MPEADALDRLAQAIYRGLGYVAPWGRHPDRVLKMREVAKAVVEELGGYPPVAIPTKPPHKVLKPTIE